MASVGAKPGALSSRFWPRGIARAPNGDPGIWGSMRSSAANGSTSGPSSRTSCTAGAWAWAGTEARRPLGRCSQRISIRIKRGAIRAVCSDMHRPYLNAVAEVLRRWKTVRGSKRRELQELFAVNRRLFKAYVLREQLDRLWTYKTPPGVGTFLIGWLEALRWQRLPEMERLGDFLVRHLEGIAAYCFHPVRFGVVESGNTPMKTILLLARGGRDEQMLLLKLKWATAHSVRAGSRSIPGFTTRRGSPEPACGSCRRGS